MPDQIQIVVNGESRRISPSATIEDLLRELALPPGRVAIERNLDILPRSQWAATRIEASDRYEIVHFVGGG